MAWLVKKRASTAPTGPVTPWSLTTKWHLLGTLFLTIALPLAGLAALVSARARSALREQAVNENRTSARLAGILVHEHFNGLKHYIASIVQRPLFIDAVARHDVAGVEVHLKSIVEINPAFDRAFVVDSEGVQWADAPHDPKVMGKSFVFRDWFKGARRTGGPYISRSYVRMGGPAVPVFAVAIPVRDRSGEVIGYLVAQNPTTQLSSWLTESRPSEAGTIALVDPDGVIAVSWSDQEIIPTGNLKGRTEIQQVLAGKTETVSGLDLLTNRESLISYNPVPSYGWGILTGQPISVVDAPASSLGRSVMILAGVGFLVIFGLSALWLNAIRRFDVALADRTQQLSRSNAELTQLAADLEVTTASVRKAHADLQQAHQELQRTELQLVQAEKLTALGQMVAGVAHEINNPLAFVTNNVAILQRDTEHLNELIHLYQHAESTLAEHQRELLDRIRLLAEEIDLPYVLDQLPTIMSRSREGLKRIQQIVKDLRNFARLDEAELAEVDISEGIRFTTQLVSSKAHDRGIVLHVDLAPLPCVTCYPAKINQVVLNLLVNAIDACQPGGEIFVHTEPCSGGGVILEVRDTGHGIPQEIIGKIFDPFFTTKTIGQGTGLGLSISYGIVKAHGGTIEVTSQVGKGTRFVIRLPAQPPKNDALSKSWVMPASAT